MTDDEKESQYQHWIQSQAECLRQLADIVESGHLIRVTGWHDIGTDQNVWEYKIEINPRLAFETGWQPLKL